MEIINTGGHKAKKALFEALIADIEIQADDSVIPRFRIPTANNGEGLALEPALDQLSVDGAVRALPHRVELRGLEPLTPTLPVWCATSCATAPYRTRASRALTE